MPLGGEAGEKNVTSGAARCSIARPSAWNASPGIDTSRTGPIVHSTSSIGTVRPSRPAVSNVDPRVTSSTRWRTTAGPSAGTASAVGNAASTTWATSRPSCSASANPSATQSLFWRCTWHGFTSPSAPDNTIAVPPACRSSSVRKGPIQSVALRDIRARVRPDGSRRSRPCRSAVPSWPTTSSSAKVGSYGRPRRLIDRPGGSGQRPARSAAGAAAALAASGR